MVCGRPLSLVPEGVTCILLYRMHVNIAQPLDDMRTHFGLKLNLVYCRAHTFMNSDAIACSCYGNHVIEIIRLDAF